MSICDQCPDVNPVPYCVNSLTIGKITANTVVKVILKNLASNNVDQVDAVNNGSGIVTIDITDKAYPTEQTFEINIIDSTGAQVIFKIDDIEMCCVNLQFSYQTTDILTYTLTTIKCETT